MYGVAFELYNCTGVGMGSFCLDGTPMTRFVPLWDFYREINFHEHMLTLLISALQNKQYGTFLASFAEW